MSQRDVPDFFAFYPYEFLSDERVLAMSLEQVGAYLLLIISQWINGSIPSDLPTLAAILKRDEDGMGELWERVGPCFSPHPTEEGRLVQSRVEVERANAIGAMARASKKQAEYRERKRLRDEAKRLLESGNVTVTSTSRPHNVTNVSNLISSYIPKDSKKKEEESNTLADQWGGFKALYPAHRLDEERACQAFLSRDGEALAILEGLRLAVTSTDWLDAGGKYVPSASKWIADGKYKDAARLTQPAKTTASPYFDPRSITG